MLAADVARDIAQELREHPERWTQDASGGCLRGLIGKHIRAHADQVSRTFASVAGVQHLHLWNDAPGRTVRDVIALCDRLARRY